MEIIAEVKTFSPFGFESTKSWDELFEIANEVGDIISVHTGPRWKGSIELIKKARKLTSKPILAKGVHSHDTDITKALDAGANWVLVVGRVPEVHLDKCWLEPLNLKELKSYPKSSRVVWNSRNLESGKVKTETFTEAREVFSGWLCQASNITSVGDIDEAADAVLIGQNLPNIYADIQKIYRAPRNKH